MSEYPKLVHWSYWNGQSILSKQKNRERLTSVYALNKTGEELAKSGHIAILNSTGLFDSDVPDPYFELVRNEGFTSNARAWGKLRRDMREQYPEQEKACKPLTQKVKAYGDYVFINLEYLELIGKGFVKNDDRFINPYFIKKEAFTSKLLHDLIAYKPTDMLNNLITDYHNNHLPRFFSDVRYHFPDVFDETLSQSEWLQKLAASDKLTYRGKRAKLHTLRPGHVKIDEPRSDEQIYLWDGISLTQEEALSDDNTLIKTINPHKGTVVTIVSDQTVGPRTELID